MYTYYNGKYCGFDMYIYLCKCNSVCQHWSLSEPPKAVVNEKRYGRRSRPETSYSEDLYSADDESLIDSRPESRLSDSHFTMEADRVESPVREVCNKKLYSVVDERTTLKRSVFMWHLNSVKLGPEYTKQGAKKVIFTACHLGKLKLALIL